jgi:hypothetical protein
VNARSWCLAAAIVLMLAGGARAQDPQPLREAHSENGRFHLRIDPGYQNRRGSVHARATLSEHRAESARRRRVWRARLASDVAPVYACLRDDGRFVVTLDEFERGGAAHAVVVYDHRGRLVREFSLRELLHGDDWKQVKVERRAVEWLPGAEFTFVNSPPQFVIKLKWRREIRIDLERSRVIDRDSSGASAESESLDAIPPEILALLEMPTSAPAPPTDPSHRDIAGSTQEAMEVLEQIADVLGLNEEPAESDEATGAAAAVVDADPAGSGGAAAPATEESLPDAAGADPAAGEIEASQPVFAGLSAEAGWAMPMPDPANPVDYVGLIMSYTETEGPSAVPLYQAAFEQCQEFDGDWDLVDAAMRGDPEALALPEIAAYLELHRDALATFHAAPQYEYRGMIDPGAGRMVVDILLPSLSKARQLAKMSVLQAKYMEANGDAGGAVDNYLSTLSVGAQLSDGPTLIENLVGIAIQDLTAYSLLDSLAAHGGDDIDYQQFAQRLESEYRPVRPMVEAFQGERACGLDVIQRLYEWDSVTRQYQVSERGTEDLRWLFANDFGTDPEPPDMASMRSALETLGFRGMVTEANQLYDRLTETALMPYQQSKQAWAELESSVSSPEFKQRNPLMSVLMPSLGRASHLSTRAITTRNATRLVANLKAYRQQHGAYPDSLDVFGGSEMTRDPFTGSPFVYRRNGDDFMLYSLGGNGVDDGGVHDPRADTNDVLYWPRQPRKD